MAILAAAVTVSVPDVRGAEPATQPAMPKAHKGRLTKPWSDMKSLTPQQKEQIVKIHGDAVEQEGKIEDKETDDITALLTPDQVAELKTVQGEEKVAAKERQGAKHKHGDMATTKPAE